MEKLTFKIEERGTGNGKAFVLIDSKGFNCGIFSTASEAEKAIPSIERNIERGRVNLKYAKIEHVRPTYAVLFKSQKKQKRY